MNHTYGKDEQKDYLDCFSMDFVLKVNQEKLGKPIPSSTRFSFDYKCPFCGKPRKLNVNLQKNVFRCARCSESGGFLKLHQQLNGFTSIQEAKKDLMSRYNGLTPAQQESFTKEYEKVKNAAPAKTANSISSRHLINHALVDCLALSECDRRNLHDRGLTDEQIERLEYRTYPVLGLDTIAMRAVTESVPNRNHDWAAIESYQAMLRIFEREKGCRYPGFYLKENGAVSLIRMKVPGFLIPVRTLKGEISGFQIRHRGDCNDSPRYTWLSSSCYETGCGVSGIEQIHHTFFLRGDNEKAPEEVYLTEGALKADIAHCLSGWDFISLMGVNNTSQLLEELVTLKSRGTKTVNIAVDMDYRSKKEVERALKKIVTIVKQAGLKPVFMQWDYNYKGIDDYLLYRTQELERELEDV